MIRSPGFTILELLLVCAIIAILSAVGVVTFRNAITRSRVQEAAIQVVADLQRARSASQRFNRAATFQINAAKTGYTLTINGQASVRNLPAGAQFDAVRAVSYSAPFGETGATSLDMVVSVQNQSATPRTIRVLGVTGKVYLK